MENVTKDSHKIEMFSRGELRLTGVVDVHSFNDEGILLETNQGILTVGGEDLHITKLNLDQGEVSLKGFINMLMYNDDVSVSQKGKGLFEKLFK